MTLVGTERIVLSFDKTLIAKIELKLYSHRIYLSESGSQSYYLLSDPDSVFQMGQEVEKMRQSYYWGLGGTLPTSYPQKRLK